MANVPIPSLPITITLDGNEQMELVQPPGADGTSKSVTTRQIAALANPASSLTAQSVFANPTDLPAIGTSVIGSAGEVLLYDSSGNLGFGSVPTGSISGILSLDHGGIGTSSLASGTLVLGNGTSAVLTLATGSVGQALISSSVLVWSNTNTEQTYLSNYSSQTTTTNRSNKQRWSDTIYVMDYGFDPTGATANVDTVLATAISEAQARGRGEIRIPPCYGRFGAPLSFQNSLATPLRIIGSGAGTVGSLDNTGVTTLASVIGGDYWMKIGSNATATYTQDITFEEICFGQTVMTSAAVMTLDRVKSIRFRHCVFNSVLSVADIGVNGTTTNNAIIITFEDCGGSPSGSNTMFRLGSTAVIKVVGTERWNGNGLARLFDQITAENCDGFYWNNFAEDFAKYIDVRGGGMTNVEWTGYQVDGASIFFDTGNTTSSGQNLNWNMHDFQMLHIGTASSSGFVWARTATSQNPIGLSVNNVYVQGVNGNVVSQSGTGSYGDYDGLRMENCGSSGVPLISFQGRGTVNNCHAWKRPGTSPAAYTYGIDWIGTSEPTYRAQSGNLFSDFGTAAQNGTA